MTTTQKKRLMARLYPLIAMVTRASILARSPALYFAYARLLKPQFESWKHPWSIPDEHTDLVIEEPGACGNHSLATYFDRHNPGKRLATLTHCAAPVIYAARHGIPCIVLTRDIMQYVDSCTGRHPAWFSADTSVRNYCAFFRAVMPYRKGFVTATLDMIAADPRNVIAGVNERFGTQFNVGNGVLPHIRHTSEGQ